MCGFFVDFSVVFFVTFRFTFPCDPPVAWRNLRNYFTRHRAFLSIPPELRISGNFSPVAAAAVPRVRRGRPFSRLFTGIGMLYPLGARDHQALSPPSRTISVHCLRRRQQHQPRVGMSREREGPILIKRLRPGAPISLMGDVT